MLVPEELMPNLKTAVCDDAAGSTRINGVDDSLMIEWK